MKLEVGMAAIGAALALAGAAASAHAAQPAAPTAPPTHPSPINPSANATAAAAAFGDTGVDNSLHISAPRRSMQWDAKGRWGLKLDYQQPATRDTQWQSIDAGGFYKLTPRLQFGATVGLANDLTDPRVATPDQQTPQPRVRLESIFKF
jgi:hypothetical protein